MRPALDYAYRVQLKPEARDTPLEEYFDDGTLISASCDVNCDEALAEYFEAEEFLYLAAAGETPSDYEEDELTEILLAWSFIPVGATVAAPLAATTLSNSPEALTEASTVELPTLRQPVSHREKVISLLDCEDYEAALVLVNGELIYNGNYWDFHAGAVGTVFAGVELAGLWDRGVESLVSALASKFKDAGFSTTTETLAISERQYDSLM